MDVLTTLDLESATVVLRRARRADVRELVALITADRVAHGRGDLPGHDLTPYLAAFDAVDADPGELLVVAERDRAVVGTLQLSILARTGPARGAACAD